MLHRVAHHPPDRQNLIRIFFLQERLKGLGKAATSGRSTCVVGAGVMGGDIAAICAMRGLRVQDTAPERIAGEARRRALQAPAARSAARRDALDRDPRRDGEGARHADVLIEAIFENLAAKRTLFARLEALANPTPCSPPTPRASSSPTSPRRSTIRRASWDPLLQPGAAPAAGRSGEREQTDPRLLRKPRPSCARSTSCRCR